MSYSFVGQLTDFWVGEAKDVCIDQRHILLLRTPNGLRAYRGECPHQAALLCEGDFDGQTLTCSAHHWQFDAQTGKGINPKDSELARVAVQILGEDVWVDADEKGPLAGPTVQANDVGHAIADAIKEQNPEAQILDRGSYLRVEAPSPCRLFRRTLQRKLERAIEFPSEIELAMSSFKGQMKIDTEQIVWTMVGRA